MDIVQKEATSIGTTFGNLLKLIRREGLKAGDRIPSERDLADRFDISRNTVREAVALLERMRIVERRPNSGIYLLESSSVGSLEELVLSVDVGLPVSQPDVRQMTEVRRIIERESIVLTCQRRTEKDLNELASVIEDTQRKIQAGENVGEEDARFHTALLKATGNKILVRLMHPFWLISHERRRFYFSKPTHGMKSLQDHQAIFEAVERQDSERAVELLDNHIGRVDEYWTDFVKQYGT